MNKILKLKLKLNVTSFKSSVLYIVAHLPPINNKKPEIYSSFLYFFFF